MLTVCVLPESKVSVPDPLTPPEPSVPLDPPDPTWSVQYEPTLTAPLNVFVPVRTKVLLFIIEPDWLNVPVPEITPAMVVVPETSMASAPLSTIGPEPRLPVICDGGLPTCSVPLLIVVPPL